MKDGLLFANAVAKSKEDTLFSEERLMRMLDAVTLDDAVKVLVEAGYGGGTVVDNAYDFEDILQAEHKALISFIRSVKLEGMGFECFFLMADYHNVKAILKARYQNAEPDGMLIEGGLYDIAWLKERLAAESPQINSYLDAAVKEIRKAFELQQAPRLIDTLVDKAMFEDIKHRLNEKGVDASVKNYFETYVDCINIASFVRSARLKATEQFFETNFVEGGVIPRETFAASYADALNKLNEVVSGTKYGAFVDKITGTELTEFDVYRDNYLLDSFKKNRSDMFSLAPIMGYYLAKQNEIKVIRLVLVCKKNGVATAEIKKRLRYMYA